MGDTELLPIYGQLDGASLRKSSYQTLGSGTNKNCGFLRRKCGEIDSIIRAAEISIQKYINYRQVVIEHAITKGILPDRNMKPSGDKAFGEIPEEWEMIKFAEYSP